jgi:hypothetical protein
LAATERGYRLGMSAWSLLLIPGSLGFLCSLLALTVLAEERVLSPRALIIKAARARISEADYTEALVAQQYERLLRTAQSR